MPFGMQKNNHNKAWNGPMVGSMVGNMNMSPSVSLPKGKVGQSGKTAGPSSHPINMYPTYYNNSKLEYLHSVHA